MQLSLDQLQALDQSQEFCALPVRMAQDKVPDDTWWMTLDALVVNGAKIKIWEAAHYVALMFDTYGDAISRVDVGFSQVNIGDLHMAGHVMINGSNYADDDTMGLEAIVLAQVLAVDEGDVLRAAGERLSNLANTNLLGQLSTLQNALHGLTSAQQCREVATRFAPEVDAWVWRTALIDQISPSHRPTMGRAHKM